LDGLELELATMVSQEMRAWRLDTLRSRVEAVLTQLDDPRQAARGQRLLRRIGDFENLLDRAVAASQEPARSNKTRLLPPVAAALPDASPGAGLVPNELPPDDVIGTATPQAEPAGTEPAIAPAVDFDGSGWLVPVHATRGTVPPYALLDAQGDVLQYVSPTPGLNLQRYLRKQVGVFGQRGQVRSLNKPHVTAERVVDLTRHLR
jgi:hypothetical protein